MQKGPRNIMVVDDEPIVREGLVHLLATHPLVGDVVQAGSAEEALDRLTDAVDILVTDLKMGALDGFALTRLVKRTRPGLPVLVLSSWNETLYAEQALEAGASGYLMKSTDPIALRDAIQAVGDGKLALSDSSWERMLSEQVPMPSFEGLQQRLFELLAQVPRPVSGLARALGLRSVEVELALRQMCVESGLVSPLQLVLLAHRDDAPVVAH